MHTDPFSCGRTLRNGGQSIMLEGPKSAKSSPNVGQAKGALRDVEPD